MKDTTVNEWERLENEACSCVLHLPPNNRNTWDSIDRGLVDNVVEYGWGITGVFASDTTGSWAYTTGLRHNFNAPELCIFGLSVPSMHPILNAAGKLIREGWRPQSRERTDMLLEGYDVEMRNVQEDWHRPFLGMSLWFAQARSIPFMQIVYPDMEGSFAHEGGVTPKFANMQPQTWLPKSVHPPSPWIDGMDPGHQASRFDSNNVIDFAARKARCGRRRRRS